MQRSQRTILRDYDIRPVKRRGQNFLVDGNLARSIAQDTLELGSRVLELGAGAGALTTHLLPTAEIVVCVEVDRNLCALLISEHGELPNFRMVEGDLSNMDWHATVAEVGGKPVIAGNLPYVLTSKVLFALAELRNVTSGAVFMVQKEVAERMIATPGGKDFGILAVVLGSVFDIKLVRTVSSSVFWPKPDVESAIVRLVPKAFQADEIWEDEEFKTFTATVKTLFGQRRKKLRNQLRQHFDMGIDVDRRPEQCSGTDFRRLAAALALRGPA